MLHNRLAMSKTERQSEAEKRHGKVLIVKKEIEELMQNYKYLYSDQIYRWFDIDDKFVVKKCIEKIKQKKKESTEEEIRQYLYRKGYKV